MGALSNRANEATRWLFKKRVDFKDAAARLTETLEILRNTLTALKHESFGNVELQDDFSDFSNLFLQCYGRLFKLRDLLQTLNLATSPYTWEELLENIRSETRHFNGELRVIEILVKSSESKSDVPGNVKLGFFTFIRAHIQLIFSIVTSLLFLWAVLYLLPPPESALREHNVSLSPIMTYLRRRLFDSSQNGSAPDTSSLFDCQSLEEAEPDVVGPGVWISIVIQVILTLVFFFHLSDSAVVRCFLDAGRLSRLILSTVGIVQILMQRISFYHGISLCLLCELLVLPQVGICVLRFPESEEYAYVFVERFTNFLISIAVMSLMGLLASSSTTQMIGTLCNGTFKGDASKLSEAELNAALQIFTFDSLILPISFIFELFFCIYKFVLLIIHPKRQDYRWDLFDWHIRDFVVCSTGLSLTFLGIWRLSARIQELNRFSTPEQTIWSFGQMVAMFTVVITILSALLQFFVLHFQDINNWGTNAYNQFRTWVVKGPAAGDGQKPPAENPDQRAGQTQMADGELQDLQHIVANSNSPFQVGDDRQEEDGEL